MLVCRLGCGSNPKKRKEVFSRKLFLNALCVFFFTLSPRRWDPSARRNLFFSVAASWAFPFSFFLLSHLHPLSLFPFCCQPYFLRCVSCHLVPSLSFFCLSYLVPYSILYFYFYFAIYIFPSPLRLFLPGFFSLIAFFILYPSRPPAVPFTASPLLHVRSFAFLCSRIFFFLSFTLHAKIYRQYKESTFHLPCLPLPYWSTSVALHCPRRLPLVCGTFCVTVCFVFFFSLFLGNLKKGRQSGRVLVRQQQMFSARLFSLRMRMPVCLYMFVQTCTCFMPQKEEDGGVLVHEYVCFISMSVCEFWKKGMCAFL